MTHKIRLVILHCDSDIHVSSISYQYIYIYTFISYNHIN